MARPSGNRAAPPHPLAGRSSAGLPQPLKGQDARKDELGARDGVKPGQAGTGGEGSVRLVGGRLVNPGPGRHGTRRRRWFQSGFGLPHAEER